jgi:phospholipid transport system substrate-binding protein
MKNKISFVLLLVYFLSNSQIVFSIEPNVFVQSTVNRASEILGSSISKDEKIEELQKIAKDVVDIKGIGYYSLGSHRKNLSEDEKKEYLKFFEKYFLKSFSSRLAEYSNPKIEVNTQKRLNEKYTMVSSLLVATDNKPEIKIDWRINTKDPQNLLIIDVVIEGVSLAKVQKEEFNSIIQNGNGDIKPLFDSLKDFVNK